MVNKGIIIFSIIFSVVLYCCLMQAPKEDEIFEKLYKESWENGSGKDEK